MSVRLGEHRLGIVSVAEGVMFDEMNEIYKEFFGSDQSGWPARTTVEARLPRKDFLLEIDCVAEA